MSVVWEGRTQVSHCAGLLPFPLLGFVLSLTFLFSCSDQLHSVPIAQMGNYQDFLKAAPQPLRDADPEQPKRLHTFGNPFKLDKKVDCTDWVADKKRC